MLKIYPKIKRGFKASEYIMHEALQNAVEVSIALGQPLLLTGEPGTGKTRLAYKVAEELSKDKSLNFSPKPLIFNTKTTSSARDLFYTYDALSHFQAANIKTENSTNLAKTADFIELQALGKAIALSNPSAVDKSNFKTVLPDKPQSTVVLIDEIDKAPRDFTNDILHEIEDFEFSIQEQNDYKISMGDGGQIVVIMTSNSEKNLPDAFLRRCVFYNIPFPPPDLLRGIVETQLGGETPFTNEALDELMTQFQKLRKKAVRKPPATAELLAWLRVLEIADYMGKDEAGKKDLLLKNLSILVKTREDLEAIRGLF